MPRSRSTLTTRRARSPPTARRPRTSTRRTLTVTLLCRGTRTSQFARCSTKRLPAPAWSARFHERGAPTRTAAPRASRVAHHAEPLDYRETVRELKRELKRERKEYRRLERAQQASSSATPPTASPPRGSRDGARPAMRPRHRENILPATRGGEACASRRTPGARWRLEEDQEHRNRAPRAPRRPRLLRCFGSTSVDELERVRLNVWRVTQIAHLFYKPLRPPLNRSSRGRTTSAAPRASSSAPPASSSG